MYSIAVDHSKEDVAIFDNAAWLIWYHTKNKLKHECVTSSKATIELQALNKMEEYLALAQHIGNQPIFYLGSYIEEMDSSRLWYSEDEYWCCIIAEGKIGKDIFIRNHSAIPLLALKLFLDKEAFLWILENF